MKNIILFILVHLNRILLINSRLIVCKCPVVNEQRLDFFELFVLN